MSELFTLQDVCREVGVTRRIVQEYEAKSLVSPYTTNKYGHLLYDAEAIEQIRKIRLYQKFGFSLKRIQEIEEMSSKELREVLEQQVVELESMREEYNILIAKAYEMIDELV